MVFNKIIHVLVSPERFKFCRLLHHLAVPLCRYNTIIVKIRSGCRFWYTVIAEEPNGIIFYYQIKINILSILYKQKYYTAVEQNETEFECSYIADIKRPVNYGFFLSF